MLVVRALAVAVALLVPSPWGALSADSATLARTCLRPPVDAAVVDAFREPACPWCPGNRGLEYAVAAGTSVVAAAGGRVSFAGSVAGAFYLVIDHGDGVRATYGRLGGSTFAVGDAVAAGAVVGRSAGGLYFGLREGDRYVDPAPRLGRWVRRWQLVPTDGSPPRPAPPPRLRCPP